MDHILESLPKSLEEVCIWSDGPSSQFKNRYVAAALCKLQKCGLIIQQNFFALITRQRTSRRDWRFCQKTGLGVSSRKYIVIDAPGFVVAANATSNFQVSLMTDYENNKRNRTLRLENLFEFSRPAPSISKIHQLLVINGKLKANILTNLSSQFVDDPPKVGDWYFVDYQNKLYPGEIKEVNDVAEEYGIETMEATGKHWKWPNNSDIIFYTKDKLIWKFGHPIVLKSCGHFTFK